MKPILLLSLIVVLEVVHFHVQEVGAIEGIMSLALNKMVQALESDFERKYDELDKYLSEVTKDEPLDNIFLVKEWLNCAKGDCKLPRKARVPFGKDSVPALKQFVAMELLYADPPKCDWAEYKILKLNVKSTREDLMVPESQLHPLRKIEAIIREVAEEHAMQCRYVYPKLLDKLKEDKSVDMDTLEYVRNFMDSIILANTVERVFEEWRMDSKTLIKEKSRGLPDMQNPEATHNLLQFIGKYTNTPVHFIGYGRTAWGATKLAMKNLEQHLETYIFEPCQYALKTTKQILEPAAYEQQLTSEYYGYRNVDEKNGEMMLWLQYFRLCSIMVNDKQVIIKNAASHIKELNKY